MPGIPPKNHRDQRFWYTIVTIGQIQHRLLKPYQRLPLNLAQLTDPSIPRHRKIDLATEMLALNKCCIDSFFAAPIFQCVQEQGGQPLSLIDGELASDLALSMRGKVSNIEIELNFARAACSRHITHGKSHGISAMVAKHVSAEIKVGQGRQLMQCKTASSNGSGAGRVCRFESTQIPTPNHTELFGFSEFLVPNDMNYPHELVIVALYDRHWYMLHVSMIYYVFIWQQFLNLTLFLQQLL